MKRVIAGVLGVAALALAMAVSGLAAGPGPGTCAHIVGGSAAYTDPNGDTPNMVTGGIFTESASCRGVVYTMYVVTYDASGASTGLLSTSRRGTGDPSNFVGPFTVSNVTAPYVCVYFTSSRGPTVYDTASFNGVPCPPSVDVANPQTGVMTPGSSPAGGGYN
jgi:hypothetical protein